MISNFSFSFKLFKINRFLTEIIVFRFNPETLLFPWHFLGKGAIRAKDKVKEFNQVRQIGEPIK